ncbi:hypothetical protein BKA93DRAFT_734791, partial [Sparassis latifolia]
ILRVSRLTGWIFGPILFSIGLIHSESLPKSTPSHAKVAFHGLNLRCIVVFGFNGVYEYEYDLRNPRKRVEGLEGGPLVPP